MKIILSEAEVCEAIVAYMKERHSKEIRANNVRILRSPTKTEAAARRMAGVPEPSDKDAAEIDLDAVVKDEAKLVKRSSKLPAGAVPL